jgi:acrylyl-CoA reductase (NADPH)
MTFQALVLEQADGGVTAAVQEVADERLPPGDVTVRVEYSSLNYKDAMVVKGIGRLVRDYPHVPGIDLAGTVEASESDEYSVGDRVVLTGWRVGEAWWGGFAARARVKAEWLVKLPDSLSTRDAMAVGTAGLTAMMAVDALESFELSGPVLVTGAAGGLGSFAVHLLARRGHEVAASTRRPETEPYLTGLGAQSVVDANELAAPLTRPLLSERWAGCIDAVGGSTLAHLLAELRYGAAAAACGNTGGNDVPMNVLPFLLRAVRLIGIDSVMYPRANRIRLWSELAGTLDASILQDAIVEASLADVPALAEGILAGQVRGRVVVALP